MSAAASAFDWGDEQKTAQPQGSPRDKVFAWGDEEENKPPASTKQAAPSLPPATGTAAHRFWEGAKAGTGGDNALQRSPEVSPEYEAAHPWATNALLPGSGVYRDITRGNYAGAAGRVVGPAVVLGTALLGGRGGEEVPPVETPPVRLLRESLARPDTPPFPRVSEGLPEVEAGQPAATQHLQTAVQPNETGNFRMEQTPRRLPGEVERYYSSPQPFQYIPKPVVPIGPRTGLRLTGETAPPVYPGANLPERPEDVLLQANSLMRGPRGPEPAPSAGLGRIPVKKPQAAPPAPPVEPAPTPTPTPRPTGGAGGSWAPAQPAVQWPKTGSPEDLSETMDIRDAIRNQSEGEMNSLRRLGNEEGFARNTKQGPTKGELTGSAQKPVRLTKTPGVKPPEVVPEKRFAQPGEVDAFVSKVRPERDVVRPEAVQRAKELKTAAESVAQTTSHPASRDFLDWQHALTDAERKLVGNLFQKTPPPGVKASGKESPVADLNDPEVLQDLAKRSLKLAEAAKKAKKK